MLAPADAQTYSRCCRRGPIIAFTLTFVLMSASIGYTNSLFVNPQELSHSTCEVTWAFSDNYGFVGWLQLTVHLPQRLLRWCQCFIIIVPQLLGWVFNFYAYCVAKRSSALLHFGNNRNKMNSERRKTRWVQIRRTLSPPTDCGWDGFVWRLSSRPARLRAAFRKAMWLLTGMTVFGASPQIGIVVLRLMSQWQLQPLKILVGQAYIAKCCANVTLYFYMTRRSRGLLEMVKRHTTQKHAQYLL